MYPMPGIVRHRTQPMPHQKNLILLGQRIKEIRQQKQMSQMDVSAQSYIEIATLSRLEAGKANPTFITLLKLSKALDVHISELLRPNGHAGLDGHAHLNGHSRPDGHSRSDGFSDSDGRYRSDGRSDGLSHLDGRSRSDGV
jgi:putative transcriptional regulator